MCPRIVGEDGGGTCVGQIKVVVDVVLVLLLSMTSCWGWLSSLERSGIGAGAAHRHDDVDEILCSTLTQKFSP